MSSDFTLESFTVETSDAIKLRTRLFKPGPNINIKDENFAIVLVHPYSVLGGSQGLLKGIASGLALNGYTAVTFDMRGVGKSTGRPSLTGFAEIKDVVSVSNWVSHSLSISKILLIGSSAGAPIAGSAVDKIEQVIGYVSIGYPFGITASILFGRHHKGILQSLKPKFFIMGTEDGFTSVKQLKNKVKSAAGRAETHLIDGVGHFQMEGPDYDAYMVDLIAEVMGLDPRDVDVPVVGGHAGVTILPLLSQVKPPSSFTTKEIEYLTDRIQNGGTEVVEAKAGAGSATLSMAYAAVKFADACLRALKGEAGIIQCACVDSQYCVLLVFLLGVKA